MWISWHAEAYVLVQQWKTSPVSGLILATLCACVGGVLYELVRHVLQRQHSRGKSVPRQSCKTTLRRVTSRAALACLHVCHLLLGYLVMLLLMTYNAWVMMAAVLGSALGHFFFTPWLKGKVQGDQRPANESNHHRHLLSSGPDDPTRRPTQPQHHAKFPSDNLLRASRPLLLRDEPGGQGRDGAPRAITDDNGEGVPMTSQRINAHPGHREPLVPVQQRPDHVVVEDSDDINVVLGFTTSFVQ